MTKLKPTDYWRTPPEVYDPLDAEFNFTLDVCATEDNALCEMYLTEHDDGLKQSWANQRCWCNPPYSNVTPWLIKACKESTLNNALVVALLKADTSTRWYHTLVSNRAEVRFLDRRVNYIGADGNRAGAPPWPSLIAIYRPLEVA